MNDTSISSAPSSGAGSSASTSKPAVKVAKKSANTSTPGPKKSVKAPSKTATKTTAKTAKGKPATATSPVSPVKAKTSPAKAPQAKATQAKVSDKKKAAAPAKVAKEKKVKVVRDSFTLPKNELLQITEMKKRAMALGVEVKKSELIRAGLKALAGMADTAFKKAMAQVPTIKTGRPAKA